MGGVVLLQTVKMEKNQHGLKPKRLHLDVVQSVRLSQSEEGTASLRQPVNRTCTRTHSDLVMMPRYRGRGKSRLPREVMTPNQDGNTAANSAQGPIPVKHVDYPAVNPHHEVQPGQNRVLGEGHQHPWMVGPWYLTGQPCEPRGGAVTTCCESNSWDDNYSLASTSHCDRFQNRHPVLRGPQGNYDQTEWAGLGMVGQSSVCAPHFVPAVCGFQPTSSLQQIPSVLPQNRITNSGQGLMVTLTSRDAGGHRELDSEKTCQKRRRFEDNSQSSVRSFMSPVALSSDANMVGKESQISDKNFNGSSCKMVAVVSKESENGFSVNDDHSPGNSHVKTSQQHAAPSSKGKEKKNIKIKRHPLCQFGKKVGISSAFDSKGSIVKRNMDDVCAAACSKQKGRKKLIIKKFLPHKFGDKICSDSNTVYKSSGVRNRKLKRKVKLCPCANPKIERDNTDEREMTCVSPSIPSVRLNVKVGATFGLLNDSEVKVVKENWFQKVPQEVLENIFCCLPMEDLCLRVSRVCVNWNNIISSPQFMPWKKLYHRMEKGGRESKEFNTSAVQSEMQTPCLRKLIRHMETFRGVSPYNNACDRLRPHPKCQMAVTLMKEKVPDCFKDGEPNPWCLICAVVLVSATVEDVLYTLRLLTSARSQLSCLEVLECFYCIATFLLFWKHTHHQLDQLLYSDRLGLVGKQPPNSQQSVESSEEQGIHCRVSCALQLYESSGH